MIQLFKKTGQFLLYVHVAVVAASRSGSVQREGRCLLAAWRLSVSAVAPSILGHCCVCPRCLSPGWRSNFTKPTRWDETVRAAPMFYPVYREMRLIVSSVAFVRHKACIHHPSSSLPPSTRPSIHLLSVHLCCDDIYTGHQSRWFV